MRRFRHVACVVGGLGLFLLLASAQSKLNIAPQSGAVAISWSATNSTNAILQQTLAPWASNLWTNVAQRPSSNNGAYYVVLSPTNDASFFRLVLGTSDLADEPDDAFMDSNGDGIDGDVTRAIFVATTGDDTDAGTMVQPVRTLAEAIKRAAAANKDVYVAAGDYSSSTLNLSNGVSIYGGYSPVDWSRNDSFIVNFTAINSTGAVANGLTNKTTLDHLTLSGGSGLVPGASAYGILAMSSPGLVVRRCSIRAGNGASGFAGTDGTAGAGGGDGGIGSPGCEDSPALFCDSCVQPVGGPAGTSPCGALGGVGGVPGRAASGGSAGGTGTGGTLGGSGAPCESCDGTAGGDGTAGVPGVDGQGGVLGNFTVSGYIRKDGVDGTAGENGNGGGGGGGGGGGTTDCDSYGSSGGGGGGGGCGGTPGTGGRSGGGSIAIYLSDSDARIEYCDVVTGSGGDGGRGGTGGGGGTGGAGGPGGPYGGSSEQDDGGDGAPGGRGGGGGRGGHGGGGAGGPSIGLVLAGGSNPELTSLNFVRGAGGAGGGSSGNAGLSGAVFDVYP